MAQTGFTPIKIYSSSTAAAVPLAANLAAGELAINTADGKLFYKDSSGVVQTIGTKGGVGSSTTTQVLYNNAGALAGSANLTFDGSQLTISGIEVGPGAGNITSNAAIGNDALLVNTTGNNNVAVGGNTLKANTTGIRNAGLGYASLLTNVSGSYNTGAGALSLAVATGSYNTTIGFNSGGSISTGGKNSILGCYSGFGAPISQTGSNYVVLSDGDGNVRAYWNGANPTFPGNITLSDGTANGVPYLNGSKALTSGTALTFDGTTLAVGSALAVGSVPENWDYTSSSPVQIGKSGFVYGDVYNNAISMSANMVYTSTTGYEYLYSDFASDYTQNAGEHTWSRAVSGTAGNALTFIPLMKLNVNGNLGIGTTSPSASAIVDAQSTTKGVRMPNMTTTQKNAIASPAAGLMVFDTTLAKLCVYTGAAWQTITSV